MAIEMIDRRQLNEQEAAQSLAWLDKHRHELADALYMTLQKIDPNIIGASCVFGVKIGEKTDFVVLGLACGDWSYSTALQALEGFVPALRRQLQSEQN